MENLDQMTLTLDIGNHEISEGLREDINWCYKFAGRQELRAKTFDEFQRVHVAVMRWGIVVMILNLICSS